MKELVMMKKRKQRKYTKLDNLLEMPREVVSTDVKMTILGFNEILIENYKNILEYGDVFIKINIFGGTIHIHGFQLNLEQMTEEDIKVTGKIDSIDFEEA